MYKTRLSLKVVVTSELVPKHSKPNKMDLFLCDRLMPKNYLGLSFFSYSITEMSGGMVDSLFLCIGEARATP